MARNWLQMRFRHPPLSLPIPSGRRHPLHEVKQIWAWTDSAGTAPHQGQSSMQPKSASGRDTLALTVGGPGQCFYGAVSYHASTAPPAQAAGLWQQQMKGRAPVFGQLHLLTMPMSASDGVCSICCAALRSALAAETSSSARVRCSQRSSVSVRQSALLRFRLFSGRTPKRLRRNVALGPGAHALASAVWREIE